METTLDFGDDGNFTTAMTSLVGSVSRSLGPRRSARLMAGAILDGELQRGPRTPHNLNPGWLLAAGLDWRLRQPRGKSPALDMSASLGVLRTTTESEGLGEESSYFAADLRVGASLGWAPSAGTFAYLTGRVFGGPVNWELDGRDITGMDSHHYQLGVGGSARLGPVTGFAEWNGLGERSLSAGMGAAF